MAAPTRTPAQRDLHKTVIVRGIAQGRTLTDLAEEIGVDRAQVSRDWSKLKSGMQQEMERELRSWIAGELLKAEALKEEVYEAWRGTNQPTQEKEWIGQTPLDEEQSDKLAALADAEPEIEAALKEFGGGHWRPKKLSPAKPNPSLPLAWNALLRTQLEVLGILKQRAANEAQAGAGEPAGAIPKAVEIDSAESAASALDLLDSMGAGRLLRYPKRRRGR